MSIVCVGSCVCAGARVYVAPYDRQLSCVSQWCALADAGNSQGVVATAGPQQQPEHTTTTTADLPWRSQHHHNMLGATTCSSQVTPSLAHNFPGPASCHPTTSPTQTPTPPLHFHLRTHPLTHCCPLLTPHTSPQHNKKTVTKKTGW